MTRLWQADRVLAELQQKLIWEQVEYEHDGAGLSDRFRMGVVVGIRVALREVVKLRNSLEPDEKREYSSLLELPKEDKGQ